VSALPRQFIWRRELAFSIDPFSAYLPSSMSPHSVALQLRPDQDPLYRSAPSGLLVKSPWSCSQGKVRLRQSPLIQVRLAQFRPTQTSSVGQTFSGRFVQLRSSPQGSSCSGSSRSDPPPYRSALQVRPLKSTLRRFRLAQVRLVSGRPRPGSPAQTFLPSQDRSAQVRSLGRPRQFALVSPLAAGQSPPASPQSGSHCSVSRPFLLAVIATGRVLAGSLQAACALDAKPSEP